MVVMCINKIEIVDAAVRGERPARIPFSCWYHFGLQHASGETQAEIEMDFYRHYDLDFLKAMDDFCYPFPEGFEWLRTPDDFEALPVIGEARDFGGYAKQLKCLEIIGRELGGQAYFINTIFSPFTWLRNYGVSVWQAAMREHTSKFLAGMEAATENIVKYVKAQADAGVSGIFYSQPAAEPGFSTREEFRTLIKSFDLRILEAAKGLPFNVLHVHGSGVFIEEFFDYPVKVVNYSDSFPSNPNLSDLRAKMPDWCLMGGINEDIAKERDPAEIEAEVEDAYAQTKGKGFICAPGCSLKTNIWESHILRMRDAVRALK